MRNWTTKEILALKRACRRGLSPEAIAALLPRHSVRGIVARAHKERISVKGLPDQKKDSPVSLTQTSQSDND
jgi:hypothetical protein